MATGNMTVHLDLVQVRDTVHLIVDAVEAIHIAMAVLAAKLDELEQPND